VLLVVVLLLVLLLLLDGAYVVTHLPTSKAENRVAGKNETKWGYDIPWNKSSFKALYLFISFFISFFFAHVKT
jgi:hypothetical protein